MLAPLMFAPYRSNKSEHTLLYSPLPMGAITKRRTDAADADGKSYALYAEILEKGWAASA